VTVVAPAGDAVNTPKVPSTSVTIASFDARGRLNRRSFTATAGSAPVRIVGLTSRSALTTHPPGTSGTGRLAQFLSARIATVWYEYRDVIVTG